MRWTTWVLLIMIVLTGSVLSGAAHHDGCADAEADCEGLICAMVTRAESVVIMAEVPFESTGRPQLPASTFRPLDHPPKSVCLSA